MSPHFGQVSVFFLPPPLLPEDPPVVVVSLLGGVGSVGAFARLLLVVRVLLATILTILCTVQRDIVISRCRLCGRGSLRFRDPDRKAKIALTTQVILTVIVDNDIVRGCQATGAYQATTYATHNRIISSGRETGEAISSSLKDAPDTQIYNQAGFFSHECSRGEVYARAQLRLPSRENKPCDGTHVRM